MSEEEDDELEEENEDIDNNDNENSDSYSSALTTMDWGLRSHPYIKKITGLETVEL